MRKVILMKIKIVFLAVCAIGFLLTAQLVAAPDKIEGPWMWMITEMEAGQGGAASTDIGGIDEATKGNISLMTWSLGNRGV